MTSKHRKSDRRIGRVLAASAILWAGMAGAQTVYEWDDVSGGGFGAAANWNPSTGTPGTAANDWAVFNLGQDPAYLVTLDAARTFELLDVRTDRVILDLNGHDLTTTLPVSGDFTTSTNSDDTTGSSSLMVGRGTGTGAHHTGTLTVRNSSATPATLSITGIVLGFTSGSTGTLILEQGALLTTGTSGSYIGVRGHGELVVRSGAEFEMNGNLLLSRRAPPGGLVNTVLVENAGSKLYMPSAASTLSIAYRGVARMTVRDQAEVTAGRVGLAPSSLAGELRVESGALFFARRFLQAGTSTGNATLLVTGANSRVYVTATSSENSSFGTGGGMSTFTIRNGGEAEFTGVLTLGANTDLQIDNGVLKAGTLDAASGAGLTLTLHTGVTGAAIVVGGNAGIAGMDFSLALADGFSAGMDDVFTVASIGGSLTGTFAGLANDDTIGTDEGYAFRINYGSDDIALTVTAIPEPGTLGLLLLAAGVVAVRRRRAGS